ncbi:hypothetical protein SAMN05192535_3364 [Shouchella rhizosphaerae]|nr:hypothetical protein SAMN05192535_3364 [Shouchella rhizosphaerae]
MSFYSYSSNFEDFSHKHKKHKKHDRDDRHDKCDKCDRHDRHDKCDKCDKHDRHDRHDRHHRDKCDCHSFFKHIARGQFVVVFLKGGGCVRGEFVDVRKNLVFLANCDCHKKSRIVTICCDDITAVET